MAYGNPRSKAMREYIEAQRRAHNNSQEPDRRHDACASNVIVLSRVRAGRKEKSRPRTLLAWFNETDRFGRNT